VARRKTSPDEVVPCDTCGVPQRPLGNPAKPYGYFCDNGCAFCVACEEVFRRDDVCFECNSVALFDSRKVRVAGPGLH
jgi:hypothetical protein